MFAAQISERLPFRRIDCFARRVECRLVCIFRSGSTVSRQGDGLCYAAGGRLGSFASAALDNFGRRICRHCLPDCRCAFLEDDRWPRRLP
jgi:hypothetical protein